MKHTTNCVLQTEAETATETQCRLQFIRWKDFKGKQLCQRDKMKLHTACVLEID